jgi:hypothetical protein
MRAMSLSPKTLVIVTVLLSGSAALAEPVGETTSVVPAATYVHRGPAQTLEIGASLEQNDRVKTDASGAVEIKFIDDTMLTVSPNSEVVLDKMLFDGDRAKNVTLRVTKGALRFVTGNSAHEAYQIKTPVATIGVRGTVIDISLDQGDMVFNTVEGVGVVCHGGTNCHDIRAGDQPIAVNRGGFRIATAAQAARLSRIVTGAHTNLSRRIGRDPKLGKGWQKRSGNNKLDNKFGKKPGEKFDNKRGGLDKLDKKGGKLGDRRDKNFRPDRLGGPAQHQQQGGRGGHGFKLRDLLRRKDRDDRR